ncbi:hypothetical protein I6M90_21465 [Acinetobacter bereziniae]|uniref:hypothetical protein n=1 Tax=Acinetobacter bereziniae TaxID=106648 RepID=UPI00190148FB|nr:hypothetical protein [Acinetobacter bereziniae]MBJ8452821.1 hypothetical protein [Acinetobacter bereziniae]MBJ8458613.1 hypothetical protein [Acinetobacter bereziniae]
MRNFQYSIIFSIIILTACEQPKNKIDLPDIETQSVTTSTGSSHRIQIREEPPKLEDDPNTSNDESNDQPLGYYGTHTLCVYNDSSLNTYTLDVDLTDEAVVEQIYFPKGGWIYFDNCQLDESLSGYCVDYRDRGWEFEGEC